MTTILQIEERRLAEQARLDLQKTAAERNRWGQFATPPVLALDIAHYAHELWRGRREPVRFLDPAIGTGSFYAALRCALPDNAIDLAAGIELDPQIAEASRRLWAPAGLRVVTGDFTKQHAPSPADRFNLILTNPPYVRHHHLTAADKLRLKEKVFGIVHREISGLAGLYCYFLLLADEWLADNGIAAWLIPSEFMTVNYGQTIRRYLTEDVTLLRIHRFCPSDVQFTDALVSSAIVVFRKCRPRSNHTVHFSFGGDLHHPVEQQRVPLPELQNSDRWVDYPRDGQATLQHSDSCTLGDLFTIKRGLATGANDFFILPRKHARELGIPARFLKPILPSPRYLAETVIESDTNGYPCLPDQLCLVDCDIAEAKIQENYPQFWKYLESGKRQGIHRLYLPSRRSPWYAQEQRDPPPFLCTYMGRTGEGRRRPFRFIWNKSKAVAANVYLLLYPRGPLKTLLARNPELEGRVFDALQRTTTETFLGESRVYGGGLYKLEPKELGRLPAGPILAVIPSLAPLRERCLFT